MCWLPYGLRRQNRHDLGSVLPVTSCEIAIDEIITAQTIAVQKERNDVDILRRRMDASVLLIKALGGG